MTRLSYAAALALVVTSCAQPAPVTAERGPVRGLFAGQGVEETTERLAAWCRSAGYQVERGSIDHLVAMGLARGGAADLTCSKPGPGNPLRSALDLAVNGEDASSKTQYRLAILVSGQPEGSRVIVRATLVAMQPFPGAGTRPLDDAETATRLRQALSGLGMV
jgi:hypothetical protein